MHNRRSYYDAKQVNPPENRDVVLKRPHTLLLMSSVAGGLAKRGAFTGAFANQIAKADGRTNVLEMVNRAKIEMKKSHSGDDQEQFPEEISTLQKSLFIPPPLLPGIKNTDGEQSTRTTDALIQSIVNETSI